MARKSRKAQLDNMFRRLPRRHVPLYGNGNEARPLMEVLTKAMPNAEAAKEGASRQDPNEGVKSPPFNFDNIINFKNHNPYHSACIDVKTQALIGLGFVTEEQKRQRKEKKKLAEQGAMAAQQGPTKPGEMGIEAPQEARGVNKEDLSEERRSKAEMVLDPLCIDSFQAVMGQVGEDFQQVGNGYIEVVRNNEGSIVGLHHLPAGHVQIVIEDNFYNSHFQILSSSSGMASTYRAFARFGDKEDFLKRKPELAEKSRISEVIHFKDPSSQDRWYGVPKWLASVAAIELFQCLHQHDYDFYLNRGVPEFMLFLLGAKLNDDDWDKLMDSMEAHIGLGNSSKSLALNIADKGLTIQLEKLALGESYMDGFEDRVDTLSLEIVSAHRVPPLLAGIQISGKLGAANEIVSATKAFQAFVVGPQQKIFETTLGNTLGNPDLNGSLALTPNDFELRKITEELEVEELDTVSRMRQDFNAPQNQGRDPKEGLKD